MELALTDLMANSFPKKKKIEKFYSLINQFNSRSDYLLRNASSICSIKILGSKIKTTKVILDITEWFPENVAFKFNGLKRWIKYFQFLLPYLYILQKVDHLIIGEVSKKKRYEFIADSKPKTIIGYYPVHKIFQL